jgi:hypothetical protein
VVVGLVLVLLQGMSIEQLKATEFSSPWIWEPVFWHPTLVWKKSFPQALACKVAWFFLYANAFSDVAIDAANVASNIAAKG